MAGQQPSGLPVPEGTKTVTEGQATILHQGENVFYNPAQVINRDLSVAVLRYFVKQRREEIENGTLKAPRQKRTPAEAIQLKEAGGAEGPVQRPKLDENIRILEGLAASGLRSIRYALEIEGVKRIDANDLDEAAAAAVRQNLELNDSKASGLVRPTQGDVRLAALQNPDGYEAVDLDPYGSPAQFLDTAVQAVSEGGLLLVTATDMAVLCGNNGEACWSKYGCYPLHRPYCHEMALRILLASLEAHANRHKRHIVPVLSLSIDFYIRVFVRVYTSAEKVKDSASKQMYVYQSSGCDSFFTQPVGRKSPKGKGFKFAPGHGPVVPQQCPETGSGWIMGGPFWSQPIHDQAWVKGILAILEADKGNFQAYSKVRGLLTSASEELPDVPLYYNLHTMCKTLRVTPPGNSTVRSAIVNAGYRVSGTHANPLGLKTDAPPEVMWDIMRCWVAEHPSKKPLDPDSYEGKLLSKEPKIQANFARANGAQRSQHGPRVPRFIPNPEANWGPKSRHKVARWDASEGNDSVPARTSAPEQATAIANAAGEGDASIDTAMPEQAGTVAEEKTKDDKQHVT
ncbi:g5591 [Coccomyxa viridis]|uniref:tRNA (guanine(26)-N(2))-dimethyltransferase n=1 Tax=Coccomyxa viridis TaxID=1274662 RepID=A0ABP1FT89_9CHLO